MLNDLYKQFQNLTLVLPQNEMETKKISQNVCFYCGEPGRFASQCKRKSCSESMMYSSQQNGTYRRYMVLITKGDTGSIHHCGKKESSQREKSLSHNSWEKFDTTGFSRWSSWTTANDDQDAEGNNVSRRQKRDEITSTPFLLEAVMKKPAGNANSKIKKTSFTKTTRSITFEYLFF